MAALLHDPPRAGALPGVYRPRRPRESPVFKVLADHLGATLDEYEQRHRKAAGPLRPVMERTARAFLRCGLLEHGFARLRCEACDGQLLLAFSCSTRGVCASCEAKRCAAWARWVTDDLARDVPHRQVVVTLPKMLRPCFKHDRSLLTSLAGWVNDALCQVMQALAQERVRPGCVARLELAGNLLNLQPHLHIIVTDGAFSLDGARFYPMRPALWALLEELVRHRVLAELHRLGLLSSERRALLLSWRHSGFSVHTDTRVARGDARGLERLARYVRRFHLAESRVVYDEASDRVVYGSGKPPHPRYKANFRVFDARDFTATLLGFVPDPFRHETIAYGEYANAVRGLRRKAGAPTALAWARVTPRRPSSLWRELIRRIYEVDPLECPCGGTLRLVTFVTQPHAIGLALALLGHEPPSPRPPKRRPTRGPPPAPRRAAPRRGAPEPDLDPPHDDKDDSQLPPWWDDDRAFSQEPEPDPEG